MYNIIIRDNKNEKIKGMLVKDGEKHQLFLNKPIFGLLMHKINQKEILKPANLLASFLSRSKLAKKEIEAFSETRYLHVAVLHEDGSLIAEEDIRYKEEVKVLNMLLQKCYYLGDQLVKENTNIIVETPIGKREINVNDLKLDFIMLPVNFKYTDNDFVNVVLKSINAPYDIDKKIVLAIREQAKTIQLLFKEHGEARFNKKTLKVLKVLTDKEISCRKM